MQRFICIGNLTKDPEVRMTQAGDPVCPFSIAVSRDTKDENGNRETDFFYVVAWKKTAENCGKYLKKGSKVAIVGRVQNRSWTAQDGSKRYKTEIIAEQVEFLTPKQDAPQQGVPQYHPASEQEFEEISSDDDLPF